eukprot:scaffold17397_cov125-Isochrysis_galbana.AAC.2
MPMCGLPFFLLSSPPPLAGPVAVWTDGPMDGGRMQRVAARQTPLRTCSGSGWVWFQCTLPPTTQAPQALQPTRPP